MKIRNFIPADTPKLIELFRATVHTVCHHDYSTEQLNAWAPQHIDADIWTTRLMNSYALVAELDNDIIGFTNLKNDGYVDMLYTSSRHQSQGVATRLLATIEGEARKRRMKRLYSDVSLTARRFFANKGFCVEKEYSKKLGDIVFPNAIMSKLLV